MFTLRLLTKRHRPDVTVTLRTSAEGWDVDLAGTYEADGWTFRLDEDLYRGGAQFKFLADGLWMLGANLQFGAAQAGQQLAFDDASVDFPPKTEVLTENGDFQRRFFAPNLDENELYDVIVIGSGAGGGTLADQLSDLGAKVLVLEAGSALFLTHTANLPRQYQLGTFEKHLWALWDEYKITNYRNTPGSSFGGGQGFNLGGRSVFWGGFIPRMTDWELGPWPDAVRQDLQNFAYLKAEDLMYFPPPPSAYQQQVKTWLSGQLPLHHHFDAPVAVRQLNPAEGTLASGMFSTADLLTEGRLSSDPAGLGKCTINLNHAVTALELDATRRVTGVIAWDLIAEKARTYRGKYVVMSAGTVESAKIAQMSGLSNASGLVGKGFTDHPILFTHFVIPPGKPLHRVDRSSKTMSRHQSSSASAHPYNLLLELGADLNQGRYPDADTLARHRALKGDAMLCEIVFLFNSPLVETNTVEQAGPSYVKPWANMHPSNAADPYWAEVNQLKAQLISQLGGEALAGDDLALKTGGLGGVAHEVGTLRMGELGHGVVDSNLRYVGHDNLYVCDLSVFPTSPAANPTLTLVALALRLATHLKGRL